MKDEERLFMTVNKVRINYQLRENKAFLKSIRAPLLSKHRTTVLLLSIDGTVKNHRQAHGKES